MTRKKSARKPAKRQSASANKPAAPTRRRRTPSELAGTVKRWGLALSPEAAAAVDAEADRLMTSGSAVIGDLVSVWAASRVPKAAAVEETVEEFARRTKAAAQGLRKGEWSKPKKRGVRFGDDKVFIRAAYDVMQRDGGRGYTWEEFKTRLLAANRLRLLDLSRADLVEAMHAEDVAESEVRVPDILGHVHFNFITLRDR